MPSQIPTPPSTPTTILTPSGQELNVPSTIFSLPPSDYTSLPPPPNPTLLSSSEKINILRTHMHSLALKPNELNQLKTYISFRQKWLAEPAQRLRDVELEKMAMRDHMERLLGDAERLREAENRLREMGMHLKAERLRRVSDGGKKVRFCDAKGEDGE